MKKLLCLVFLCLLSCSPGPSELYETAEFEMLQTNYPHARQLYQEIIDKHPESEFAAKARERLQEIAATTESREQKVN